MRLRRVVTAVFVVLVALTGLLGGAGGAQTVRERSVFAFGDATFHGSTESAPTNHPIVGMAAHPSGGGYWLVATDGGVFAFGAAGFHGSTGAVRLNRPIVGMAAHPSGNGYWLVAADGGVFAFGAARFHGSTGGIRLNQPVTGMAAHPSGNGYWLVADDGGIFTFGSAGFHGSTAAMALQQPVVAMAAHPSGNGYWLVSREGEVFALGAATGHGSAEAPTLHRPVVDIAATPSGGGYWIANQAACGVTGATADEASSPDSHVMLLTDVAIGSHPCFERVTFSFEPEGGGDDGAISYDVGYVTPPFRDTAGRRIHVQGNAFLMVRTEPARRADLSGPTFRLTYTGPTDIRPTHTSIVRNVRFIEDFEANMVWIIGLDRRRPFEVFELDGPDRLVVDVERASG